MQRGRDTSPDALGWGWGAEGGRTVCPAGSADPYAFFTKKAMGPCGATKNTAHLCRVACGGTGARSQVPACGGDPQLLLGRGSESGTARTLAPGKGLRFRTAEELVPEVNTWPRSSVWQGAQGTD